ncbi:MAG: hypothetical protein LBK04_05250 [Clostridiales Family XIII bacterium]|jgi:ureidoglycolate lyase|nr:hypothetical protein [Clostridiales Family XIII bacterium]
MKTIAAKPLSRDAFKKYGEYQDLLNDEELAEKSIFPEGFFPDVLYMDWGGQTPPTVSVCQVKKPEKIVVNFIEAHKYTHEGLLPIDGDVVIYVGKTFGDPETFSVDELEAFIVPKGTYVKLYPLILHGSQFGLEEGVTHVLCQLPARTFANDMLAKVIEKEEEMGEIVL